MDHDKPTRKIGDDDGDVQAAMKAYHDLATGHSLAEKKLRPEDIRELTTTQTHDLFKYLRSGFHCNMSRHPQINWVDIQDRLVADPKKAWSVWKMWQTDGEPDVVGMTADHRYKIFDCSKESPLRRRNLVYDALAVAIFKQLHPGEGDMRDALSSVASMGIELLDENDYRETLQEIGIFDSETQNWISTPQPIRDLGTALLGFRDDEGVQIEPANANDLYGARGYRGKVLL